MRGGGQFRTHGWASSEKRAQGCLVGGSLPCLAPTSVRGGRPRAGRAQRGVCVGGGRASWRRGQGTVHVGPCPPPHTHTHAAWQSWWQVWGSERRVCVEGCRWGRWVGVTCARVHMHASQSSPPHRRRVPAPTPSILALPARHPTPSDAWQPRLSLRARLAARRHGCWGVGAPTLPPCGVSRCWRCCCPLHWSLVRRGVGGAAGRAGAVDKCHPRCAQLPRHCPRCSRWHP